MGVGYFRAEEWSIEVVKYTGKKPVEVAALLDQSQMVVEENNDDNLTDDQKLMALTKIIYEGKQIDYKINKP